MRWTADKVAMLRDLGPRGIGSRALAVQFGCTMTALQKKAEKLHVRIARRPCLLPSTRSLDDELRARWDKLLPKLKESLRAEIALFS